MAWKVFSNESLSRCDDFWLIVVQIGAILAIFRPFEIFLKTKAKTKNENEKRKRKRKLGGLRTPRPPRIRKKVEACRLPAVRNVGRRVVAEIWVAVW